ncbi:MAG: acyltransferase [Pseudomonadota bacterium]|jgi:peptidoglycan/LPS O-acetylase OafA/YrhL
MSELTFVAKRTEISRRDNERHSVWSIFKPLFSPPARNDAAECIPHFYGIDFLRGIAATIVLIWHYQHFFYTRALVPGQGLPEIDRHIEPLYRVLHPFYNHGYWAVQLFWIISGFVFAHVYAGRSTSAGDYAASRVARLYPLNFVTLAVITLAQAASWLLLGGFQIVSTNDAYHFFLSLFLIPHWGFQDAISFNAPVWSVSVELGIYIVFYFVARHVFALGLFVPLVLAGFGYAIVQRGTPMWFFGMCLHFFFVGCAVYLVVLKFRRYRTALLSICFASLGYFAYLVGKHQIEPFTNTEGYLFVPMVLMIAMADFRTRFAGVMRRMKWFGDATYSIYMWHMPVQVLILTALGVVGRGYSIFYHPLALFAWIAGMLVLSHFSFVYIEKPAQRWVRDFFKNLPDWRGASARSAS